MVFTIYSVFAICLIDEISFFTVKTKSLFVFNSNSGTQEQAEEAESSCEENTDETDTNDDGLKRQVFY